MADELTADNEKSQRTVILKAASGGNVSVQEMLEAIKELEKLRQTNSSTEALDGDWLLVWTSGTKKYQEFNNAALDAPIKSISSKVIQRLDVTSESIENEVYFSFGFLAVGGKFEYTDSKRIQFTFSSMGLKLGFLPAIQIPLGKWAKGWLQTTYIDQELHIERGNQGGVSVYIKGA